MSDIIKTENLTFSYEGNTVVDRLSLDIKDGEFVSLLGPSGCGKSTTLRMIAGLEHVDSGTIHMGEVLMNPVPPKNRDIAMVFQNYALYPTMKVFDNIAFPLKMRHWKKEDIRRTYLLTAKRRFLLPITTRWLW